MKGVNSTLISRLLNVPITALDGTIISIISSILEAIGTEKDVPLKGF